MTYTETLTLTVPAALASIAAAMGRHFDFDTGGALSFRPTDDGLSVTMTTRCTPEFLAQALHLLAHPAEAWEFCRTDGEARWGGECPTLEDVAAFCASAVAE